MTTDTIAQVLEYNQIEAVLDKIYHHPTEEMKSKLTGELYQYLKNHLHKYDVLKDMISEAFQVLTIDDNGYIIYIDESFCEQLGYQPQELLYHHYRILHAGVHDDAFYEGMWQTIRQKKVWKGDICTASKSKQMFWFRTIIIPNANDQQGDTSYTVFRTDISDVKQDDQELVEALDDDYRRLFSQLMNLTFRVQRHKKTQAYRFRMFEGKLAHKLTSLLNSDQGETIDDVFFHENYEPIDHFFAQAFEGEEVIFKHYFKDLVLYTMLSPIYEKNEVMEVVGSTIDISSLEEAEKKVRQLAYYDSLTQLPNRSKFRDDLKHLVSRKPSNGFAVVYCDIDRLKYINDTLGEGIGDQVIDTMAKRLNYFIEDKGVVYRYGGDEFSIIIDASKTQVTRLAKQLLQAIKQPTTIKGHEFFITSSMGLSYYGIDAWTDEELIHHASVAVHYCKMNGRNSYMYYTPKMNESYQDILLLEADIRKAVQRHEFELYYQPQLNVSNGDVMGLEALIRWEHPKKGSISPGTFIPLAEESGIITQIGEWVIGEACRQHVAWVGQGFDPIRIAVNVSAIELQRFDFADRVAQILADTKMDPRFLEIEITENSVMQNTEDCIQTMNTLKQMGISLSIDDFGTGYSSFGYLKQFPINFLKIDQSFVRSALKESSSSEIVKAMIQLAHTFGLKVVAEGVEEADILALLQDHNCDYYQGYYYSRPLPAEKLEKVIYNV
ncbi:PAS domain S-box-containing protein/diguanylate cyclase (GGDEF) domain-containing protein [Pelagirhabdus alkalitolerans]|uniref:PAS domain S-box-containing protein/diguanylate cyclase (GGDEF) domain-containing protein n=1 Tax=Pelagirhabdus alkalitolerans TaxID=1612202 RepID=A0A1G6IIC7_9BACI|nr:EAL domain-containing protein [Pelagirhabdus alkalitolerans]SDC06287.1 PAS domain S-box-containing protein/diguanylate cyclase (GGDEF) domain-containing protein [Pelagirhabdus alkalitolerans]